MTRPLELTTIMPDCGARVHATITKTREGYIIRTKHWTLHADGGMSIRDVFSVMHVAHTLTEHAR